MIRILLLREVYKDAKADLEVLLAFVMAVAWARWDPLAKENEVRPDDL